MTARLAEAIERSVAALDEACEAAKNAPLAAACEDDPTWLSIEMDRWVKMPPKIREVSQLGQLHVTVYWEQWFAIGVHPKKTRATWASPSWCARPGPSGFLRRRFISKKI